MIHGYSNVKVDTFFEFDNNGRTRGHVWKMKKNRFNRDLRQHFFTERIINIWNSLDNQTVLASSAQQLQVELRQTSKIKKDGSTIGLMSRDPRGQSGCFQ